MNPLRIVSQIFCKGANDELLARGYHSFVARVVGIRVKIGTIQPKEAYCELRGASRSVERAILVEIIRNLKRIQRCDEIVPVDIKEGRGRIQNANAG